MRMVLAVFMVTVALVSSMMALDVSVAFADTTPDQCDGAGPKYYCSHVDYTNNGSTAYNINRWYKCALGNSATWCQRYWAQDYTSWDGGSTWNLVSSWGEGGRHYDNVLSSAPWEAISGGSINQLAMVVVRIRYWDPQGYAWCSPNLGHYLWAQSGAQWGGSAC